MTQPNIPRTRRGLRSGPFGDTQAGDRHWHLVRSNWLTPELRASIDAVDLTEHELLDKINIALDRIIAHYEEITDEVFTEEDVIEWLT
ncbi:hypothetical protein LCGC14_2549650 [marine sediment metagenome]|uniref:Uncharacterized protein n=1 Tax=marine sediment metagenome TaxID=412755 RepID=A0A0F9ANR9_9ZZZZ